MKYDALVIGAGPAGSVTAYELARRGCRVLMVDRAHFPRGKVCGCCLNGAAVETLDRIGLGHVLEGAVPLNHVNLAAGTRSAKLKLPGGVALSRDVLDSRLVAASAKAGVEFRPGFAAKVEDSWCQECASVTIVASGLAGGNATPQRYSRIGAGVTLPARSSPDYFTPGSIFMAVGRGGYVGLVRVEDNRLDVAAAFDTNHVKVEGGLGPAAEQILCEVGWPTPSGLAGLPWKGTPALTRRPIRLGGHRNFVVGDAAGYVEPFTGEGMAWAIMSAAALAPIAARGAREWHDGLVREWEKVHALIVGRRQRVCRVVSNLLRSPVLTRIALSALKIVPTLSHPVVASINRPTPLPRNGLA